MLDIADMAVYLVSDLARSITGTTVDASCGKRIGG